MEGELLAKLLGTGVGASVLTAVVLGLVQARLKRAEQLEAQVEAGAAGKLDQVAADVGTMKTDMRLLVQELSMHRGEVAKVQERVDGLSANYGTRISKLEERSIRVMERLSMKDWEES